MHLIDAHNHLQDSDLQPYHAQIFADLQTVGLRYAVVNGTTEADWVDVAALAAAHPWVVPSFGLHPWYLRERSADWLANLEAAVNQSNGRCAIGEVGLDRWMQNADLDDQKAVLSAHLRLAAGRELPVTIHCLQAWGALADLLAHSPLPKCGFLLHAYGGPLEMVDGFVKLGAYFSFSGYFLHERKAAKREVFAAIPFERLLVETDAPAMPLPPERDRFPLPASAEGRQTNHPANIRAVHEGLAEIRGLPLETLSEQVSANFHRLFGRVCPPSP